CRILHRQKCPAAEMFLVSENCTGQSVVETPRGLVRKICVKMVVDEGRRERKDRSVHSDTLHPLHLPWHFEKRLVQAEMHTANIELNVVALATFDRHRKIPLSPYKAEEVIGHEMTVDIGDHLSITKIALDSSSGSLRISNHASRCSIDEPA